MMLMTPPMALEPQSVLCGPRSTSMRSMSSTVRVEKSNARVGLVGSLASMPSIRTSVCSELAPRRKTEVIWPGAAGAGDVQPRHAAQHIGDERLLLSGDLVGGDDRDGTAHLRRRHRDAVGRHEDGPSCGSGGIIGGLSKGRLSRRVGGDEECRGEGGPDRGGFAPRN